MVTIASRPPNCVVSRCEGDAIREVTLNNTQVGVIRDSATQGKLSVYVRMGDQWLVMDAGIEQSRVPLIHYSHEPCFAPACTSVKIHWTQDRKELSQKPVLPS